MIIHRKKKKKQFFKLFLFEKFKITQSKTTRKIMNLNIILSFMYTIGDKYLLIYSICYECLYVMYCIFRYSFLIFFFICNVFFYFLLSLLLCYLLFILSLG